MRETTDSWDATAVWRQVDRIAASSHFERSERLQRFLRYAVERVLEGGSSNLKEYSLGVSVFDRGESFDPRTDSIVRTEARRLRQRLESYYSSEGKDDRIHIEFPKGGYAPVIRELPSGAPSRSTPATAASLSSRPGRRLVPFRTSLFVLALLAAVALVTLVLRAPVAESDGRIVLTALTNDTGLSFQPTIARDGSLFAYSSDRAGGTGLDIWVETVGKGDPLRLTSDAGDELEPALTADGSEIAFRTRDGLFTMSSLGGRRTMIHPAGRDPRFSPDGARLAFWTGPSWPAASELWVVRSSGGDTKQLAEGLYGARHPLWSPDGGYLLVAGRASAGDREDLWLVPLSGGDPVRTGIFERLREQGLTGLGTLPAGDWLDNPSRILFSARLGDGWDIWSIPLSVDFPQRSEEATPFTTGPHLKQGPSGSRSGAVLFTAARRRTVALALDLDRDGLVKETPKPLLDSSNSYFNVNLSPSGKKLLYETRRSGNLQVRLKDLITGQDVAISDTPSHEHFSVFSPGGDSVAFQRVAQKQAARTNAVYVASLSEQTARQVADRAGILSDWSKSGNYLVNARKGIWLLDVRKGVNHKILDGDRLFAARFSPGDEWLAFQQVQPNSGRSRIYLAPYRREEAVPATEWISVTEGVHADVAPCWSSDGALLYFVSDRTGLASVWARRIAPNTGQPQGEPFLVYEPAGTRTSLGRDPSVFHLSIAGTVLVLTVVEQTGNIWMAEVARSSPANR